MSSGLKSNERARALKVLDDCLNYIELPQSERDYRGLTMLSVCDSIQDLMHDLEEVE